ncbi:MAG TPA: energy transducer TonB [Candidatus Polarisedimenticolia bacterium]|nr:energy transducer TonB [Candidatus Polarisedimenticolia bacterium]
MNQRRIMACLLGFLLSVGLGLVHSAADEPVYLNAEIKAPERTVFVPPVYPDEPKRAGIEGKVVMEVVVGQSGSVEGVRFIKSYPIFNEAAEKAVRQWKYKPALKDGKPVRVYLTVLVEFSLKKEPVENVPIYLTPNIKPPERIVFVRPDYPEEQKQEENEGKVVLEIVVNKTGDVEDERVLESNPEFENAAIIAVRQWKYKPALKDGEPVKVYLTVIVEFTLK